MKTGINFGLFNTFKMKIKPGVYHWVKAIQGTPTKSSTP